jgi:hypothetical protein
VTVAAGRASDLQVSRLPTQVVPVVCKFVDHRSGGDASDLQVPMTPNRA